MGKLRTAVLGLTLLALGSTAHAFPSWMQEGKAGRFMFNFKFGPAITAKAPNDFAGCRFYACYRPTGGAIVLDFGIAVDQKRLAYILIPLQFQIYDVPFGFGGGSYAAIMIPVGFQYDIPIHKVPGLYITPAGMMGYAAWVPNCNGPGCYTVHSGFIGLEVGAKFIFKQRWNVGFIPFSLPIFFGSDPAYGGGWSSVSYRLLWYGGVNF